MLSFLKSHPFAVEAFFEHSLVLTFAIPKEQLESLIPACLELDTYQDGWAFIAVAMVQTKELRPKGFPKILGHDFFLIGFRIFVRYTNAAGKRLRGLYILKSETDKQKMKLLGNVFTHYNYSTTDISQTFKGHQWEIKSKKSGIRVVVESSTDDIPLPVNSPFPDWKTARRFAGPLPFTFTCLPDRNEILIIEGMRQNWKPKPIEVTYHQFTYLDSFKLEPAVLANAFFISNVLYHWKKGKIEYIR